MSAYMYVQMCTHASEGKLCIVARAKPQVWKSRSFLIAFCLRQVSQDGKSLLDKLQRPLTPGSSDSLTASANYSKAVHHVLDVIHEVLHHQRQLENIWQHRKVRLHQRLQLRVFQQDVQQVSFRERLPHRGGAGGCRWQRRRGRAQPCWQVGEKHTPIRTPTGTLRCSSFPTVSENPALRVGLIRLFSTRSSHAWDTRGGVGPKPEPLSFVLEAGYPQFYLFVRMPTLGVLLKIYLPSSYLIISSSRFFSHWVGSVG